VEKTDALKRVNVHEYKQRIISRLLTSHVAAIRASDERASNSAL